jgi:hypothetical protein
MRPLSFIFPAISSADMDKGFIESIRATTITVSSNLPWQLTVRSEDQDMGKVEDYIKPLSDFLWSKSSDTQYTMISTESGLVDSSANYADNREIELNYKMLVGWTRDKPGSYGLTLRFTKGREHGAWGMGKRPLAFRHMPLTIDYLRAHSWVGGPKFSNERRTSNVEWEKMKYGKR